ncbi:hypothetical protein EZS27_007339 [termite gut metagenome]|uniref:BACON domain-containing protein n=1 Tax=termite gut metagenome TaxID=433724 RepID=A0A5J4SII1_9ZZZZ
MKKHVFFWKSLAGVLPFLFLGMGCSSESEDPEPFLRISGENQTVNLLAEGSSQTIAVETNTSDWTISVNGNWCTATKEGESIVISAGKNDSEDSRSATVTASVGNIKVTITVTQAGTKSTDPYLRISDTDKSIALSADGSSKTIAVDASTSDWTVSASNTWCAVKKEGTNIVISAGKNDGESSRSTTVTASLGDIKVTITVTQAGTKSTDPYLRISDADKSIALSADGSSKTIAVDASTSDWTVSASDSWCTVKKEGTNIVITAGKNDGTSSRSATVTASLGSINVSITVTQAAPSGQIPIVAWTKVDIGPSSGGSYTTNGNEITITGKGKFEGSRQSFTFIYREVTGNFVMTANVISYSTNATLPLSTPSQAQAGLMLTPIKYTTDIKDEIGNDFFHALSGKGANKTTDFSHSHRLEVKDGNRSVVSNENIIVSNDVFSNVYIKLERVDNKYTASYSIDGVNGSYILVREGTFVAGLPEVLCVGLALSSADNSKTATATFGDVRINGELQSFPKP